MDAAQVSRRRLALLTAALAACGPVREDPAHGGPPDAGAQGTGGARAAASASSGTGSATSAGSATGGAGTGGAGTGGAGGAGVGGSVPTMPPVQECFAWAADAGGCPTNEIAVIQQFLKQGCPTGWFPFKVDSPPTTEPGMCCYTVEITLCPGSGRPYLVDGRPRTAAPAPAHGWSEGPPSRDGRPLSPRLDRLTARALNALAAAWTADALLEHASVASFSRLSLALLGAGAPADLVARAHRAALDEIRHAERCFALAGAYAGRAIAPGPFPLGERVAVAASLPELLASSVREGCVGETVAAVMAAEQRARAVDPAVRAVLAEIARDEAEHAELAWRIAAWAVRAGGVEVREAAARAVVEAAGEVRRGAARARAQGGAGAEGLEAHGRLDSATAARVVEDALREVVGPSADALLGAS